MSRVLTTLLRLKHMVKLTNIHFLRPSGFLINRCLGPLQRYEIQAMSTVTEEVLSDPKRNLDYKELIERKKEQNVVVIDVREHSEIKETGKIPGSVHIPLNALTSALVMADEEFLKTFGSSKPKLSSEVIFSCRSGKRSLTAMKHALEAGYKKRALSELTEEEFQKKYSAPKPPQDTELIFSCRSGSRSLKALKLALELGYKNARNFKGGWLEWEKNTKS